MHRPSNALAIVCACLLLAACGSDKTESSQPSTGDESLPKPDAVSGSVTGMPNPGMPNPDTPAILPAPADDLASDSEDPEIATEDAPTAPPDLPPHPPATITVEGSLGKPPPDTMPVMPAHPPANAEQLQARPAPTPPPES